MSKDLKRGILGLAVIAALFFAIRFVKKARPFDRDTKIHAIFRSTGGIEVNNDVMIKGLKVGKVVAMEPSDQEISRIKISFEIDNDLNIPVNSVAHISPSVMGASKIIIERGNSQTYLAGNDVIPTREEDGAMDKLKAEAKPLAQKINNITDSLSQVLEQYNNKFDTKKQTTLRQQIASLTNQLAGYKKMADAMRESSTGYLNKLNSTTGGYAKQHNKINEMISNANAKITKLNEMNLGSKVDSIGAMISGLNRKISGLNSGRLGALTSDRATYDDLSAELLQTEIMLDDIRVNPKRYMNYSVFGKSSKSPELTEPDSVKERRRRNVEFNRKQQELYKNK